MMHSVFCDMIAKNNPFNIRYKPLNQWKGQIGNIKGFCVFTKLEYGIRAACYLLMISYPKRHKFTYAQLIESFAPRFENPTDHYIRFVCDKCNTFPWDIPCNVLDYALLLRAMWQFEQGNLINCPNSKELCDLILSFNFKRFVK